MEVDVDQVSDFLAQWSNNIQGNLIPRIIGIIVLVLIAHWLINLLVGRSERVMVNREVDETLRLFLVKFLRYGLYALILIVILSLLGLPMASVIAVLGASAFAIGLALQDSLKNIASGVLIVFLKPYTVGEFVEIGDHTGTVMEVELFHTRIRTPDNKLMYVPNSNIMENEIINYTGLDFMRVDMVFGIGYDDDVRKAKEILQEILDSDKRIRKEPAATVAVGELADSSVNFFVQPFVARADAPGVRYYVTEQVKLRFDEEGISIPYPQRDVHLIGVNSSENDQH